MRIGVIFPQMEIGADPAGVQAYAQAAEDLGYAHLLAYDHVLGANPAAHPIQLHYTHVDMFHEPLVLFGFLAAVTRRIELVTGVLALPQRQAPLVAKQAAEVDVLSKGRLRLGVGIGWNQAEAEAMGEDFHTRARRMEEQIELLRALWTQELVDLDGRWHHIRQVGLNPLPVQRPIPIWIAAGADAAVRRAARLGDGWFPQFRALDDRQAIIEQMRRYAREAGRDPAAIGIEGRVDIANAAPSQWAAQVRAWQALGATHLSVNTMKAGFRGPQAHIDAIRQFMEVLEKEGLA